MRKFKLIELVFFVPGRKEKYVKTSRIEGDISCNQKLLDVVPTNIKSTHDHWLQNIAYA